MANMKFRWLSHFLRPRIFLLGLCCGLLVCAMLGRTVAHESYYKNFVRFGGAVQNDTSFFVTASQIKALIKAECRKDQILVLIGGSSVLWGAGQPIRALWTKKLQENLGQRYCVFNFAAPAGSLAGYASVALESVANDYKKSILVADSAFPPSEPDGMIWYKHFFWDAYYKNMLDNSIVRRADLRISQIRENTAKQDSIKQSRIEQVRLGMWLDSLLYFNDLWTYVHYNYAMTIYNPSLGTLNWGPRKLGSDYDYEVSMDEVRKLRNFPPVDSASFKSEFAIVRSFHDKNFKKTPSGSVLNEESISQADSALRDFPITDFSRKVIITQIQEAPYYLDKMSSEEKRDFVFLRERQAAIWEKYGYGVVRLDNVTQYDYGDRPHLNTFGGYKLAENVAAKIKKIMPP